MSHQAFFDALHAAKVRMTARDEIERDLIADRDDNIGDELAERLTEIDEAAE